MKILVINCGSSSLKYQLIDMTDESVIAKGLCERIGIDGGHMEGKTFDGREYDLNLDLPDHTAAFHQVKDALLEGSCKVIDSLDEITAIGHRIVQGGDVYNQSVLVTPEVIREIDRLSALAPLHNPAHIQGINACTEVFGSLKPQVVVFDNAFHSTMPKEAYSFAIPQDLAEKYSVRKYGFHGTSHKYLVERYAEMKGISLEGTRIITCHLGNGSSITAVKDGKCIDTSMGITPLDGLIMGTRSGSIDASAVTFLQEHEGWTPEETSEFLNKKCGLLGVSGFSSDMRDNIDARNNGDKNAKLATDMLFYQIRKFIGAYTAALNGVDAILFAGGIGENSIPTREAVVKELGWLGIKLDEAANDSCGKEVKISTDDSAVEVWVIPTNEELAIARDTKRLVEGL
ncbi:MAG: acetate kinase [Clostridia bacterium]|nr:acetate kinase [Clostridia bacterium]